MASVRYRDVCGFSIFRLLRRLLYDKSNLSARDLRYGKINSIVEPDPFILAKGGIQLALDRSLKVIEGKYRVVFDGYF